MMGSRSANSVYLTLVAVAFTTFQLLPGTSSSEAAVGDESLKIDPKQLVIENGMDGKLNCKIANETGGSALTWLSPKGVPVQDLNNTRMTVQIANSTLTLNIFNATEADSGDYVCRSDAGQNGTAIFKVYIMPSYWLEGMIILGVNCVLLLVFIICTVFSQLRYRRELRASRKLAIYSPADDMDNRDT